MRTVRRAAATTLAATALVVAIYSTAASIEGYVEPGVVAVGPGYPVEDVVPTGIAWRDGIRPGQLVVRIEDSTMPGGWLLETAEGDRHVISREAPYDADLRGILPLSVLGLVSGGLAVVFLRGHRSWTPAAACAALAMAAPALMLQGTPGTSTLAMGAAAAAPAIWLAWRPRLPIAVTVAATALIVMGIAAWSVAHLDGAAGYVQLEPIRDAVATWGTILVAAVSVAIPITREDSPSFWRPRLLDVALVAMAVGAAFAAVTVFAVAPIVPGVAILGVLLVLPAGRRILGSRAERFLLADVREHAALEATEVERARLAHELHDAPLQQLAGVIRRLELVPEARAENDQLRTIADELRSVATELRPPVLDDLGLAAAIEFVAEKATSGALAVEVALQDLSGLTATTRPPSGVELAVFRIAQEAISNAVRHAHAATVRVTGTVGPDRIDLEIADDGRGLDEGEARSAARRGRLGLASMRRRAEAIDADLSVVGSSKGTLVRVRWQR